MSEVQKTVGEAQRFMIICAVSFSIDAGIYSSLTSFGEVDSSWAKRMSFACVAIWGFLAHKTFTFRSRSKSAGELLRFSMLYLTGWVLNSIIHDAAVASGEASSPAFALATIGWAVWNFLGQKMFVFRSEDTGGRATSEEKA